MVERKRRIIVGVDETGASQNALRWAVAEARTHDRPLRIVSVASTTSPVPFSTYGVVGGPPPQQLEERFNSAVAMARSLLPAGRVSGALLTGSPARAILSEANGAGLLVVGSPAHSAVGGLFLGSVTAAAAAHATCPVVVVRDFRREPDGSSTIVVGVDGSEPSMDALAFAFDQAAAHGRSLTVLHCADLVEHVDPTRRDQMSEAELREETEAWLTKLVAPYADKAPGVQVVARVVDARPAQALSRLSRGARMVVVGSRGHGAFTGMLLGSVSQNLLHHAHCTVVVVHGSEH